MPRRPIAEAEIRQASRGMPFISATEMKTIQDVSPYAASLAINMASWIKIGNRKLALVPCVFESINYIHEWDQPYNQIRKSVTHMTKTSIKNELLRCTEGSPFVSPSELRKIFKCGSDKTRDFLADIDYVKVGKRKVYLVEDIAKALADRVNR